MKYSIYIVYNIFIILYDITYISNNFFWKYLNELTIN